MYTLLSKIFIKNNLEENEKRSAMGVLCSILGITLNVLLSLAKIIAGSLCGSIAIVSDGLNNLSDAASSIVTLIGFKVADMKPDLEHPYGHGRMEYVSGFIVSVLILLMAFTLLKDSVLKVIHPKSVTFSLIVVGVLLASILVKCYMFFYNSRVGKNINSETLIATAKDSLMDCIATSMALAAMIIEHLSGLKVDGYFGTVVGLFVLFAGISVAKDTLNPLLGQPPKKEFVDAIKDITLNFDEKILGMHDLLVHDYGPRRRFVTLHAEVDYREDVLVLHEIIDALEYTLAIKLNCLATVHLDPIVVDDERVNELKDKVEVVVKDINSEYHIHDFRVVFGENNTNIIFDMVVPIDEKRTDNELKVLIFNTVREKIGQGYTAVVHIDKDMGVS